MLGENQAMEEIALETDADVGHAEPQVAIAGGGPPGLWLASELAGLAGSSQIQLLLLSFDSAEGSRGAADGSSAPNCPDGSARQTATGEDRWPVAEETPAQRARRSSITEFIRERKLLPAEEIDQIMCEVPTQLVRYQHAYAEGVAAPPFSQFIRIPPGGDAHGA